MFPWSHSQESCGNYCFRVVRIQLIAGNLLSAMKSNDEETSAALCTWLANRLPDLKQVKMVEDGDQVTIDLVFDEQYEKQAAVTFSKPH